MADKKREREQRKANAAKVDSVELVQKMRDEYEAQMKHLGETFNDER